MSHSPARWPGISLIAACGLIGYAVGASKISSTGTVAGEKSGLRTERTSKRERLAEENTFEDFKQLLIGRNSQPNVWKIVSRLSAVEIPDALRVLRETRATTASGTNAAKRLDEIESAIYYRWAEFDPVAARADVAAIPGAPDEQAKSKQDALMKSVLTAWMKTDPNAAYRSVKDQYYFSYMGRDMLVKTWTAENVFENLKRFPENHEDLLGGYCVSIVRKENQRNAMLKALKDQPELKDRDWGYMRLFREWAYTDFPSAIAEAKKVDRPGFERSVLEDGLTGQPALALRWAASQNITPSGQRWGMGYSRWLESDKAEAKRWLDEQAPVWETAGHFEAVAVLRTQELGMEEKIDIEAVQPVWIALMAKWKSQDPEAAEKWLNGEGKGQGIPRILSAKGNQGDQ